MFKLIHKRVPSNAKNDILSGLTVALALVPEAVAFALLAGLNPLVGLYAAFTIGIVTSILGGRPGMISGATGAIAVVIGTLVALHGVEYLFAAVVLTGIIQIVFGLLRMGKFIRLVPHPVFLGFVNGLAIVIFLSQVKQFKVGGEWITGTPLALMLVIVAITMMIIHFLPKLTRAVPSTLVAIVIGTLAVLFLGLDTRTVGDIAPIGGVFPPFHLPDVPLSIDMLKIVFPYAIVMALVGLIESLLTLNLIDDLTETTGQPNRECIGQGVANTVTGFFGGMGGCAMIGQSMINVKSGGRTRIAGIAAALFLLIFILVGSPIIEMIPLAALVGVMFMVVIGTFAWNSFKILRKVPLTDAFVTILVTIVTVLSDLAVAVVVGVIVSALAYAWNNARRIHAHTEISGSGAKIYRIQGPLFFGSADGFSELFDVQNDPEEVIIEFSDSRVVDQSALQAIEAIAGKYELANKRIQLRHLSRDCHNLLTKAGHLVIDSDDDPDYALAVNYSVKTGILDSGH